MLTEEEIVDLLKKKDKNNMKKQKTKTVDDYIIQSEEEWKEILKYHNVSYYPRFEKKLDALNKKLLLTEGLSKKEESELKQKIMWIEKKLYIRR